MKDDKVKKGFDDSIKMCKLYKRYKDFPEQYKDLVRKPKWVCKKCGRVSTSTENICKPEKLKKTD